MRTVTATRYVTPLREGGSLPAVVEADDDGLYVVKFRGAGQGPRALVSELLGGEIARAIGLRVPEIVFIEVDPMLGRNEPDGEIHDLVQNSGGLNLALDFLPSALPYDPIQKPPLDAELASSIVWLDAFISNVDRTVRNTNMLMWHRNLWLIDHGASFYFQHRRTDFIPDAQKPFVGIKDHVLIRRASQLAEVDPVLSARLSTSLFVELMDLMPDAWLEGDAVYPTVAAVREAFVAYMTTRLENPHDFLKEAIDARARAI